MDINGTSDEGTPSTLSKALVKPSEGNSKDATYVDLYLSVTESPYRISRLGNTDDTFYCNDTLRGNSDVTLNVQNNDCTIFLPQLNYGEAPKQVNESVVDPLSVTSADLDPFRTLNSDDILRDESVEKLENDVSVSCQYISETTLNADTTALKYGDTTIFIPGRTCSDIRDCPEEAEFDPLGVTGIASSIKSPVKNDSLAEMSDQCVESSPCSNELNDVSLDATYQLPVDLDSSDMVLKSLADETGDIGSLLMLSTELNDSLSSSNDIFSSKSTVKEYNCTINPESQPDIFTPSSKGAKSRPTSKQLIFNSFVNESPSTEPLNENHLNQKSILLNISAVNESLLGSSLNNVTDQDVNASISFSNYDKWLPSMKTQLKELMKYIKLVSAKNEVLENKVACLSKDNEDLKTSIDELNLIHKPVDSEKTLLETELEMLKVENHNLKKEMNLIMDNYNSLKNEFESCKAACKTVTNENDDLKNQISVNAALINEYDSLKKDHALCDLKLDEAQNELNELQTKLKVNAFLKEENDLLKITFESLQIKHKNALCEIERLKNQLVQMERNLDENELRSKNVSDEFKEKYMILESDYQNLKDNLKQSEMKLNSLQEENKIIDQLKQDKEYLSTELSKFKNQVAELETENVTLTEEIRNQELNVKDLISKFEHIENENSVLKQENVESMQMLYELLNIQHDCTLKELINKFQKQFYDFTLLEEKINQEKFNNNIMKNENAVLKEENKLLIDDIKKLEEELKQNIKELNEEKTKLSVLKRECSELQTDFEMKLKSVDDMNKNRVALNEKYENFKTELCACLGISTDSHKNIIVKVSDLVSELSIKNQNMPIMQDKIKVYEECSDFWHLNKNILVDIIKINNDVEEILEEVTKGPSTSDTIDSAVESLLEKCSHYKAKLQSISQTISPVCNDILKDIVHNLSKFIAATLSVTETNLQNAKKLAESSYRMSLSGGSLQDEDSKLKNSIDQIVNSSEADLLASEKSKEPGVLGCLNCDPKLKEMHLLLVKKNGECESQQLEINNLKSRYYSKCQALDSTRKEMYKVKMELAKRERKYLETRENLKILQEEKVLIDVSTQCDVESPPPKAPLPPAPNFVQVCKMKELHRKLEKMNKINLCLKEDSRKKDAKIASLSEELKNLSKPSSAMLFNRSILEDKTNTSS